MVIIGEAISKKIVIHKNKKTSKMKRLVLELNKKKKFIKQNRLKETQISEKIPPINIINKIKV